LTSLLLRFLFDSRSFLPPVPEDRFACAKQVLCIVSRAPALPSSPLLRLFVPVFFFSFTGVLFLLLLLSCKSSTQFQRSLRFLLFSAFALPLNPMGPGFSRLFFFFPTPYYPIPFRPSYFFTRSFPRLSSSFFAASLSTLRM